MSANLKSVNLKLNEELLIQLQQVAQRQHLSLSEIVSVLLTQQLAVRQEGDSLLQSIRELRHSLGHFSDSTEIIRRGRDQEWKIGV
jgi:antitoxin component of RelBE/YafQ-DinJ toxin-antitoxin module